MNAAKPKLYKEEKRVDKERVSRSILPVKTARAFLLRNKLTIIDDRLVAIANIQARARLIAIIMEALIKRLSQVAE